MQQRDGVRNIKIVSHANDGSLKSLYVLGGSFKKHFSGGYTENLRIEGRKEPKGNVSPKSF